MDIRTDTPINKCEGCPYYNQPYWSIISPCENCPRQNVQLVPTYYTVFDPCATCRRAGSDDCLTCVYNKRPDYYVERPHNVGN